MSEISEPIKKAGRGGRRPGAGRKPNYAKRLTRPVTAALILAQRDEIKEWNAILDATIFVSGGKGQPPIEVPHWGVRLEGLKYLTDRRDGKPVQAHKFSPTDVALGFGNLATPTFQDAQPGTTDKPN